jgi:biopolymer transport protein ExbD
MLVGQTVSDQDVSQREITIMADKALPYEVLKRVMQTCTDADYGKISLAVIQKEKPVAAGQVKTG